jgi:hypothetical protein
MKIFIIIVAAIALVWIGFSLGCLLLNHILKELFPFKKR